MDLSVRQNENIREIEDIIDIQKANGNINVRQVVFNLPSDTQNTESANLAKSLESGLSKTKSDSVNKKKFKKLRSKRHKSPLPDVISWPSDSDITVLRMKLCLTSNDLNEKVKNVIPGDGLHQPDSSSMVNLATLMLQSQSTSKHSVNIEEYLLPLTSWEQGHVQETKTSGMVDEKPTDYLTPFNEEVKVYEATCNRHDKVFDNLNSKDSEVISKSDKKSKLAKFLRLYFCPCCTCLYKMEKMREEPSAYFNKRRT